MPQSSQHGLWPIIDFHVHIRPPWSVAEVPAGLSPADTAWWRSWSAKFTDPDALQRESAEGEISLSLLSSTLEGISGIGGPVDHDEIRRHNDYLGRLAADSDGRWAALATVDAFSGEAGAREAERAITELGHVGIVVDSSRDGLFTGAPSTRPVFDLAAQLGVPIQVHPNASEQADRLIAGGGRAGNSFGRGHINGTAFLTVLEQGIPEALPDLDIVFTGIGLGALLFVTEHPRYQQAVRGEHGRRPNLYFDFMGLDPAVLRFALDILGPERLVVGSDWPIHPTPSRAELLHTFDRADVGEAERQLIASGNACRILGRARRP